MPYTAQSLGLGSCWVQLRLRGMDGVQAEQIAKQILGIQEPWRVPFILGIGYPAKVLRGRKLQKVDWDKIINPTTE